MAWDWGIALGVPGLVALDLVPVGVGFAVPGNPRLAKGCFLLSGALLTVTAFGVLWFYPEGGHIMRIAVAAIFGALIFGSTAAAFDWVDRGQQMTQDETSKSTVPDHGAGIGSNNTIYGNVKPPANMGSNNTIIGPTDSKGNVIIHPGPGEMAIGAGAQAGPGSLSIGAGAGAGLKTDK